MQLAKIERDILVRNLQIVVGIIVRKHNIPILINLLIKKEKNKLLFISTDLDIQITTYIFSENSENQIITTTVAARKLLDIVKNLPIGEVIISLNENKLIIKCVRSIFTLQTLKANTFPILSLTSAYISQLKIQQREFKKLLNSVYFAMANNDLRYYLNGVLLILNETLLTAVATDSYRIAIASIFINKNINHSSQEIIIPRKTILELQRLLDDKTDLITINFLSSQIHFIFNNNEIVSKLIDGKFPDYKKIIPESKNDKNSFLVSREKLQCVLKRVSVLTSDKFKGIHLILTSGKISFRSSNSDHEEAYDEIDIIYNGNNINIGFNVTYLLDILTNIKSDMIQINLGTNNSSAIISLPSDQYFKYIVMPMRI